MGGCRCIFRDCVVSTSRNPGMHFFHFPIKDQERFAKWIEMSGADTMLKMPHSQQRNRVICARHFLDDNFMNYKKERLMAKSVPTLMRLSEDLAWDYENLDEHGHPKLITLEKPNMPHLIAPPDFECPLEFTEEEKLISFRLLEQSRNATDSDELVVPMERQSEQQVYDEVTVKCEQRKRASSICTDENISKKAKVLLNNMQLTNKTTKELKCHQSIAIIPSENMDEEVELYEINHDVLTTTDVDNDLDVVESTEMSSDFIEDIEESLSVQEDTTISKQYHDSVCEDLSQKLEAEVASHAVTKAEMGARITALEAELRSSKTQAEVERWQLERRANHLDVTLESFMKGYNILKIKNTELQEKYEETQQQYNALQTMKQDQEVVSTSKEPATTITVPTKSQLFNGIKRYLSSSMVALVRMEMFSSTERAWKPDERRIAVDLLNLGEQIYNYFCDEWRFRLPALRQARTWLNEAVTMDDEEDL